MVECDSVVVCHSSLTHALDDSEHPHMAVFVSYGEALALGLASGPACITACGPVLVPSLLAAHAGFKPHVRYLSVFLAARLVGYMIFAVVAWELGLLASMLPAPRVLLMGAAYVLLASVLFWYAYSVRRSCTQPCADSKLIQIGKSRNCGIAGAASLGFLTGLNLCPPFVAFFFLGTSVWFVPFISLGCIVRNQAVLTVARMAMALIALYYLSLGIAMLLGKKTYGY